MATVTDVEVANASFPTVRQDLNDILEAIATNFSADAEPTTTYPNQWWYETDTNKLYIRNEANDAWIHVLTLDQTTDVVSSVEGVSSDKIEEGNSSVEVVDTGTGFLQFNVDGAEIARIDSDGMKFGDNEKAIFGAGSDLQIYHDGSDSYISDQGTGNLRLRATNLIMGNAAGTATYARGIDGGTFDLYYNNSKKLETVTGGVTITGTCTATAFSGDGSGLTGISAGGALEFISTTDISNVATVDFTLPSGYDAYQFVLGNVVPASDSTALYIRTSANGGSSFDAGSSDYAYGHAYLDMDVGNSEAFKARSADYQIEATRNFVGGASGETGISGDIRVYFPSLSARTLIYGNLVFQNDSARHVKNDFGGARLSSASANAIRFLFNTGNLESGTITLYGMKNA